MDDMQVGFAAITHITQVWGDFKQYIIGLAVLGNESSEELIIFYPCLHFFESLICNTFNKKVIVKIRIMIMPEVKKRIFVKLPQKPCLKLLVNFIHRIKIWILISKCLYPM